MTRKDIYPRLGAIMCEVFDLDSVDINDTTTADDIPEWDSLSHIQLVVAVEKAFGIKFSSREIMRWQSVGELADSVIAKIG